MKHYSHDDTERDEAKASCATPIDRWGTMCHKPVIGIDYEEGWPVCREHLDAYLKEQETQ